MKKIPLLFLLLTCLTAQAGGEEKMQRYFLQTLKGEQAEAPARRCKIADIAKWQNKVWAAWREANSALGESDLPPTDSIGAAPQGAWQLPQAYEPNAVMPFYFGYKGCCPAEGYPLFIYLHGSGPKENEWSNGLLFAQRFADAPSLYFVPQIPNEGEWYRWYQRSKQYAWEKLLRQALLRSDVNPNRLYVFGISEGGYGSQRLASFYADYWAAAGPMAGGEPLKNAPAENLANTPLSLRTGAEDKGFYRDILTGYTRHALDSLQQLAPNLYRHWVELIPGRGHHIDYSPTTPWLSQFSRNPWPLRFVWEDFEMDGRHRTGFANLLITNRPDSLLRTRYDVSISNNVVRIEVKNIHYRTTQTDPVYGIEMKFEKSYTPATSGSFTLFLNEKMVSLSRPVQVIVNGRTVFSDQPRPNVASMLRSVATFYDPMRIFPVAIDINL